jgi:hypothetical protein
MGNCEEPQGRPRCSSIALTPLASFTYANTRRLPPHLTQASSKGHCCPPEGCSDDNHGAPDVNPSEEPFGETDTTGL